MKFEKERKWTSVIHFHKKAIVNLAKCTITAHAHDTYYTVTQAWPVNCLITLSNNEYDPIDCPISAQIGLVVTDRVQ